MAKNTKKQPTHTAFVATRIPIELYDKLAKLAASQRRSVASILMFALEDYLKANGADQ